jgi:hypothetical protein
VNWTVVAVVGASGEKEKSASGATTFVATSMSLAVEFCPPAFAAVSVTWKRPALANACVGLGCVELLPSPKFHCQDVGLPVLVSVNVTASPTKGFCGALAKLATGAFGTADAVKPRHSDTAEAPIGEDETACACQTYDPAESEVVYLGFCVLVSIVDPLPQDEPTRNL